MARLLALALVLTAVAAACSGDDSASTATTTTVDLGPDTGNGVLTLSTAGADPVVRAAVELARADIDAAGGVLGEPLSVVRRGDADVAIGSTSFSTLPSAELRARAVADVVAGDRLGTVAVLVDEPDLVDALSARSITLVPADDVAGVVDAEPDAVILPVGQGTADQIAALIDQGYSTGEHGFYLAGDRVDPTLGFAIGDRPGVLEGVRVVQPGAEVDEDLRIRLLAEDRTLDDLTGSPEAYDAAVIAALAAEAAGSDDPDAVATEVRDVTREGDTCTGYEECRAYLADGGDITYVGLGGSYDLGADGRPTRSQFTVYEYGGDNLIDPNRTEYVLAES